MFNYKFPKFRRFTPDYDKKLRPRRDFDYCTPNVQKNYKEIAEKI